jgi:hypothetical protein
MSVANIRRAPVDNLKLGTIASNVAYAVRDTLRRSARLKAQAARFSAPAIPETKTCSNCGCPSPHELCAACSVRQSREEWN